MPAATIVATARSDVRNAVNRRAAPTFGDVLRMAAVNVCTSWTASGSGPTTVIPGTFTSSLTGPSAMSASPLARLAAESVPLG